MNKLVTLTRFAIGQALVHAGLLIMPPGPARSSLFKIFDLWTTKVAEMHHE